LLYVRSIRFGYFGQLNDAFSVAGLETSILLVFRHANIDPPLRLAHIEYDLPLTNHPGKSVDLDPWHFPSATVCHYCE
jgi:hypothetical protein